MYTCLLLIVLFQESLAFLKVLVHKCSYCCWCWEGMHLVDLGVAVIWGVCFVYLFSDLKLLTFHMKVCGEEVGEWRSSWSIWLVSESWLCAVVSEIREDGWGKGSLPVCVCHLMNVQTRFVMSLLLLSLSLSLFCSIPSSFKFFFHLFKRFIFLSRGFYLFACGFMYFIKGIIFYPH